MRCLSCSYAGPATLLATCLPLKAPRERLYGVSDTPQAALEAVGNSRHFKGSIPRCPAMVKSSAGALVEKILKIVPPDAVDCLEREAEAEALLKDRALELDQAVALVPAG